jgi:hypothetical protein
MTEVLDPQTDALAAMDEAARPRKEHEWLRQFVGEWTYEMVCEGPGMPATTLRGSGVTRAVGDLWTISEGKGDMPGGGTSEMVTTLGYDPRKGRFVGTWLGTMMSYLWVYDGFLDADERVLTLESTGPSMTKPGDLGQYRDVITVIDRDYYTMTGNFLGDDGAWHEMMKMHFRRKK